MACSTGSVTRSARGGRTSGSHPSGAAAGPGAPPAGQGSAGPGAWLELAVRADNEAVEAISEILGRVAPGGTAVEPAFELIEEGLAARPDLSLPVTVRAYLPARDPGTVAAAVAEVDEALGHLRAFDLRPIGELATRVVHETDWADAWKAHFPVLRIGERIVIRPTWRRHRRVAGDVVLAMDPGMAFGTGLHPTTRLCLQALEDAACLVFLESEIGAFATAHSTYPREKFIAILRKTWRKMSPAAREAALGLDLPAAIAELVRAATAE